MCNEEAAQNCSQQCFWHLTSLFSKHERKRDANDPGPLWIDQRPPEQRLDTIGLHNSLIRISNTRMNQNEGKNVWSCTFQSGDQRLLFFTFFFFFFTFFFNLNYFFLLLFKYSCLHFLPTTLPHHLHLPPSILPPFGFVYGSFIHVPWWPFPFFPLHTPLSPPLWLLSTCCLFQSLWLYFACLFCWLGSTYRWDHMVFVFHRLTYFT